jgi:heat shock protein HslJ
MSMQPSRSRLAPHSARSHVHAASAHSRLSIAACFSAAALVLGGALAGCTLPTHPDSAAPPTDPYNPAATQLLDDTQWQLSTWTEATGRARQIPDTTPITLNLSTDGGQRRANGFSGCNRFTGTYDLTDGKLSFGPLASTRMACAPGPASALEQPFLQGLAGIDKTGVQMRPPKELQITLKTGDVLTFNEHTQP